MRKIKKTRAIIFLSLLLYLFTVLWFTIWRRPTGLHTAQFELFWSYKKWFAGDWNLGYEILGNIAMFIPFGFLLSSFFRHNKPEQKLPAVMIIGFSALFSLAIETSQLILMRGLFEWDDLINNSIGALAGLVLYVAVDKFVNKKYISTVITSISVSFAAVCMGIIITGHSAGGDETNTPRIFCFQIDKIESSISDHKTVIYGFAFRYEHPESPISLIFRSTETGIRIRLTTEELARHDVNNYFLCDYDYTASGFMASTAEINPTEEYEVMIKGPWSVPLSTGVYVKGTDVHYEPEKEFIAPAAAGTCLEEIVDSGSLRVYRPDYHCWVYQFHNCLYWIVDSSFNFEDDDTTYIQYQLYTTQEQNLPQKRIENGWMWDNIGGYFEDYEINGDFGEYRVMKRELPDEYSITCIVTGYYKDGEWIWKNYFRPVYEFS